MKQLRIPVKKKYTFVKMFRGDISYFPFVRNVYKDHVFSILESAILIP